MKNTNATLQLFSGAFYAQAQDSPSPKYSKQSFAIRGYQKHIFSDTTFLSNNQIGEQSRPFRKHNRRF